MSEIKVNSYLWEKISDEERDKIAELLKEQDLLNETDMIIANADESSNTNENFFCDAACNVAFTSAQAACAAFTNPIAIAACIAAAEEAKKECRRRC